MQTVQPRAAEVGVVENPVQLVAPNFPVRVDRAIGIRNALCSTPCDPQERRSTARAAHVDFIALNRLVPQPLQESAASDYLRADLLGRFLGLENGFDGQQVEPCDVVALGLDMQWVPDDRAQHLVAAAESDHGSACPG